MLGKRIYDPDHMENGGEIRGMELLPEETVLKTQKIRMQVRGRFGMLDGVFAELSGMKLSGYEIHMGETRKTECENLPRVVTGMQEQGKEDGAYLNNVYGSYVHGIFDEGDIAVRIIEILARRKGVCWSAGYESDYAMFRESQYDKLAQGLREHMDMEFVYGLL